MATSITQAQTIKITTKAQLVSLIGAGPSTQTLDMVEKEYSVDFSGYSQGQQKLADGVSGFLLISACNMISVSSDQEVDITLTVGGGTAFTIPATKQFSYESGTLLKVELANSSGSEANIDFITAAV